jgi:hypothetical protein
MVLGRRVTIIALLVGASGLGAAQDIPLPRPKPPPLRALDYAPAALPADPEVKAPPLLSACQLRLPERAVIHALPPLNGPGGCGGADMVKLEAVILPDKSRVALTPPATLACSMAEAVADWVREDIAPAAFELGAPLRGLDNYASYDCRGRNNVPGAKLSEHGRGNALDIRAVLLVTRRVELTDAQVSREFRVAMRKSACTRFMTVLGPGSDGYHENHVHVDLAQRSHGHRMCQWDIRTAGAAATSVPLPRERPKPEPEAP